MIYFLFTLIIGFIWLTRDILRVPANFNDSWFKRFARNRWIDPEVSWKNQYILGYWMSFIISTFSDLYHTLGTIINASYMLLIVAAYYKTFTFNNLWHWIFWFIGMFVSFGLGVFIAQYIWREKLNKS